MSEADTRAPMAGGKDPAAARLRRRARGLGLRLALYVLGPTCLVVLWHYASAAFATPRLFPDPLDTYQGFLRLVEQGLLVGDIVASMKRIALGFAVGALGGFVVGLAAGYLPAIRQLLYPYIHFFRFISPIAWLSMALLWLGSGEASKVALIIYTTTFIVMVNTMEGVFAVPTNRLRAARCFGARDWQVFLWVVVPSALAHALVGSRLAMANSFATIVAAEMLAADAGLGFLSWVSRQWLAVDHIFVAIICLGIIGFVADRALVLITDTLFRPYRLSL